MDIIFIRDLEVETVIGVFDWERKIKQKLIFNIEMATDIRQAAKSDDLNHTVDYNAISKQVKSLAEASSYQLIEALAEAVANLIMQDFCVRWLSIQLDKPAAIPFAQSVGVKIERGQR
ncbi:MAG: dihydroneopterin aldolase [Enterobacterales bacterium]|nr:dihydroneopterin aldolase [Enterobacterales bacterium]